MHTAAEDPYAEILDARSPDNVREVVRLGTLRTTIKSLEDAARRVALSQYYGLVREALSEPAHLFRGVKRPMLCDDDPNADERVLIYSATPDYDFIWIGGVSGRAERVSPPQNRVFVVVVAEALMRNGVIGTIENWTWIHEDYVLHGAPIGHGERYTSRLWSR